MSRGEPTGWITVNGNHVPLFKGQSKADAVKSFVENKKTDIVKSNKQSSSSKPQADRKLTDKDYEKMDSIADRYISSTPVSGSWDTEAEHEQKAIAKELGISLAQAKKEMIENYGFDEKDTKWAKDDTPKSKKTSEGKNTDEDFKKVLGTVIASDKKSVERLEKNWSNVLNKMPEGDKLYVRHDGEAEQRGEWDEWRFTRSGKDFRVFRDSRVWTGGG